MLCPTVTLSLGVAVDCCGLRQRRLRRKLRTCVRTYRWKVWGRLFHGWASRGLGTAVDLGHCHRDPLCVAHATRREAVFANHVRQRQGRFPCASFTKRETGKERTEGNGEESSGEARRALLASSNTLRTNLTRWGLREVLGYPAFGTRCTVTEQSASGALL